MNTDVHLVLVSCPPGAASLLAQTLVEQHAAACVSIIPAIKSVYRWQGSIQHDDEALLLIKAPASGFAQLKKVILANHPYELPEIIAVNPADGHAPYLEWILSSCK